MAHRLAMACVPMLAIGENQLESLLYVLLICKIISTDTKLISDLSFDCGGAQNFRLRQTTFSPLTFYLYYTKKLGFSQIMKPVKFAVGAV
jgi:hypothetical protein